MPHMQQTKIVCTINCSACKKICISFHNMHILIAQRQTNSRHNNVNDETKTHATTRAALQQQTGRPRPNRLRRTCALFGRRGGQTIAERSVACFCPRVVERHVLEKSTTTKPRQGKCQGKRLTTNNQPRCAKACSQLFEARGEEKMLPVTW